MKTTRTKETSSLLRRAAEPALLRAQLPLPEHAHGIPPVFIGQSIEEEHSVQVIGLVLEHPGQQAFRTDGDGISLEIEAIHPDPFCPGGWPKGKQAANVKPV